MMGPESIFVWRIRLCLLLTVVGLAFIDGGKERVAKPEQMVSIVSDSNCAAPAHDPAALKRPGSPRPEASDKPCTHHSGQPVIRTSSAPGFRPEVGAPSISARVQ